MFLERNVKKGQAFACYGGYVNVLGDPSILVDNTYQTMLTVDKKHYVLDAFGLEESFGKGPYINDGLTNNAKCRIRAAPKGAKYCLVYALNDYLKGEEMETTYDRGYWMRKIQWDHLSVKNKIKAADLYKITPDMIV